MTTNNNLQSYIGQKVHVYRNLHKGAFSVRVSGKVVGYCDSALLTDCEFRVGEGSRQTCIRTHVRSVHAYVTGKLASVQSGEHESADFERISYNPFSRGEFYNKTTGAAISNAAAVIVRDNQCFARI